MARVTGLEPAASGVTGRRSNQLSYTRAAGPADAARKRSGELIPRFRNMARVAGLEPAASRLTGRGPNQLGFPLPRISLLASPARSFEFPLPSPPSTA